MYKIDVDQWVKGLVIITLSLIGFYAFTYIKSIPLMVGCIGSFGYGIFHIIKYGKVENKI